MQEFTLPNGLHVIFEEHSTCDSVAIQCFVRVGSVCESDKERGISHLIEHMLFKGSRNYRVGEIANTIEANGGNINAYTTFDHTVYYTNIASSFMETGLRVIGDAVLHSVIDPLELEREKEVVVEEIRRSNDNPSSELSRKTFAHMYAGSEISRPIIGSEESVRSFSRELVYEYYKKWYHPTNMSLVVAGKFDAATAKKLVEDIYGEKVETAWSVPRLQYGKIAQAEKRKEFGLALNADQQICRISVSFAIPNKENDEAPAISIGAFIFGGSDGARLQRQIRDRDGLVAMVHSSVYGPSFQGLFSINAITQLQKIEDCAEALGDCLADFLFKSPTTEKELARARGCIQAEEVFGRETPGGLASKISGSLTTKEGPSFYEKHLAALLAVESKDIQTSLQHWLNPSNATVVCQTPNGTSVDIEVLQKKFRSGFDKRSRTFQDDSPKFKPLPISGFKKGKQTRTSSIMVNDGIRLIYRQDPHSEVFNVCTVAAGGLRVEKAENNGIYYALGQMLGLASQQLSYEAMLDITESYGAEISGFSGRDSFGMQMSCVAEQAQGLLKIFCDAWWHPQFPKEQFVSFQRETHEQIKSTNDSPSGKLMQIFQNKLYGSHPYGRAIWGSDKFVDSLSATQLHSFYEISKGNRPWIIGAVGPYDTAEISDAFSEATKSWKVAAKLSAHELPPEAKLAIDKEEFFKEFKDREQTHICLGTIGLSWTDPRRYSIDVAEAILGGQGGRLFMELRDKRSFAYTVAPIVHHSAHRGIVGTYIATATDKAESAVAELKKELKKLADVPPSKEELQRAQRYLTGTHALEMERTSAQSRNMALMELYTVGYDEFEKYSVEIRKVTAEQVSQVMQELFEKQSLLEVLVGKS